MMEKRILFITHLYYPALGGAERVFKQLAEGLVARGWKVTVLTSDALSTEHYFTHIKNNLPPREVKAGVEIIRESIEAPLYKLLKAFDLLAKKAGRFGVFYRPLTFGPHFSRSFWELIKQRFPLVIAGPVPTTTIFYSLIYKFFCPSTKVIIFPAMHIKDLLHRSWLALLALRLADFILPVTVAERSFFLNHGLKKEKVGRFFLGVESQLLKDKSVPYEEGDFILYLGQEGEHKRIPLLIKAMVNLWAKGAKEDLVIAGARTQYSWTIDRLINELPLKWRFRVHRYNNISEEEKIYLLDRCLVMVNPSSYESFGLVFLEAWARKKPVVAARIPALEEIIEDGVDGLLFEDKNQQDLENKLELLLSNRKLARTMAENGYEKVLKKFTQDRVMERLETYLLAVKNF